MRITEKLDIDRTNMMIKISEPRLKFTEQEFTLKASREWNRYPDYIRHNNKLGSFKKQTKEWIKLQRHKEPD